MSDPKYKDVGESIIRLAEECAEVIQMVCKIERFGLLNYHPDDPKQTPNLKLLLAEIADVKEVLAEVEKDYQYEFELEEVSDV